MEARTIEAYVFVGGQIRYLMNVGQEELLYGDEGDEALYIRAGIREFVSQCKKCGLHVTRRVADREFKGLLAKWDTDHVSLSATERAKVAVGKDARELIRAAETVEAALFAEAGGIYAYVTRDKRYSTERLLRGVDSLFSPGVFAFLPEVAKYDFGEAGRCIAFETPTAAAFHLMRGTEDVLRWFYRQVVKRGRKTEMWGNMISHLRARRDAPPDVLLNNLDNIRRSFRNPTQHPEKIYGIEEAQDLLGLSLEVVNRMVKHIYPGLEKAERI